jgi:hypothetical protein
VCVGVCTDVLEQHAATFFMVDSEHGGGMLLQYVCSHLEDLMVSQAKGP